jgi:filamentous hemagglutinin family protein
MLTWVLLVLCLVYWNDTTQAQVPSPPITTSGLNTQVNKSSANSLQYDITGGTRAGTNLFHSFGQFNVPATNIANFLNDSGLTTSNILGRVTGGNPSSIFGTVQTTDFGNANLFLMNPAGIVFGPNATLNVGGSVTFTTANYLRQSNGINNGNFYADPASPSLLTAAPVAAFGFLGPNAASIAIQGGTLEVPDGKTLAFIGGPRTFTTDTGVTVPAGVTMTGGSLSAPNGLIYMATVTSLGEIPVPTLSGAPLGTLVPPSSDPAVIRIRSGEFVMDHAFLTATNTTDTAQPAIEVNVQGTMALRNASSISSETSGTGRGSDVGITAQSLQMDGASIKSLTTGDGPGGSISITGGPINLTNGAQIVSSTTGAGNGGNINISATEAVSIFGYDTTGTLPGLSTGYVFSPDTGLPLVTSGVFTTTSATGTCPGCSKGGAIQTTAPTVTVDNAGTIATITSGDGQGGQLALNVATLNLTGAAQLWSSAGQDPVTFEFTGSGRGGDINVTASNSVLVSGGNPDLFANSIINSTAFNTGNGGKILITAPNVSVQGGTTITSSTFGPATGGNVIISASQQLSVAGLDEILGAPSSVSSLATSTGNGGTVTINAESITLTDSGRIHTESFDVGNAGDVVLQAQGNLSVTGIASIDSVASSGSSGKITIGGDMVTVAGHVGGPLLGQGPFQPSQITNAGGRATGDIEINARQVLLTDGARINSSPGNGAPGAIRITASESVVVSDGAKVRMDTSSASSTGGLLAITAQTITLDQGILQTLTVGQTDAAPIMLQTGNLTLSGGFIDSTTRSGNGARGGDVTLAVTDKLLITGQFTGTGQDSPRAASISTFTQSLGGDAGNISISARTVELSAGAQINSSSNSPGRGGAMSITAGNLIALEGSGTALLSEATKAGAGGAINLHANEVQITDGAIVSAKSVGTSLGSGRAGNVTIQGLASPAQSVLIDGPGSGIFTNTQGTGAGGNILIETGQSTTLKNGAAVSASSTGTMDNAGDAGMVTIHAGNTFLMQDSSVTTQSTKGGGGQIEINASNLFRLVNSKVSSSVLDGTGGGGNITIDPNVVVLQNSQIIAQAVQGAGGKITIFTPLYLKDSSSVVSASSQFGLNGTVTIQSPTSNLSESLGPLTSKPSQAQSLLTQRCAALANGQASSFVVAGREQLPADPGGWLSSPLAFATLGENLATGDSVASAPVIMAIAARDTGTVSLRRLTPAGFLIANFADSEATGCHS